MGDVFHPFCAAISPRVRRRHAERRHDLRYTTGNFKFIKKKKKTVTNSDVIFACVQNDPEEHKKITPKSHS